MSLSYDAPLSAHMQMVRAEYDEMPNLRLTPSEAQRRFGLEPAACSAVLDALLLEDFLWRTRDGLFARSARR
jgi:hypothetical protein